MDFSQAQDYGLNIHHGFLKLFVKIEKHVSFRGVSFFISSGAQDQKLCNNRGNNKSKF